MNIAAAVRTACILAVFAFVPGSPVAAQSGPVYGGEQVTQQPRLASAARTADLLRSAARGMTGTVRMEFVIGDDGKVEPASVKVIESTSPDLAAIAEKVALKLEFRPGEKDGKAVRTMVRLPLTFQ